MDDGHEIYNYIYKQLRNKCKSLEFCLDASDLVGLTKSYKYYQSDVTHPDSKGNKLIAEYIYKNLIKDIKQ